MYANEVTAPSYARFWRAWAERMRSQGIDAPEELTETADSEAAWLDPRLLLSQTCGYPYATRLRGSVRLVATPHYTVEGCDGPNYSSWIITHAENDAATLEDLRGSRAAINGPGSQSGYNSLRAVVAPLADGGTFFAEVLQSGSHRNSMHMVAQGDAECAAIDTVCWALTLDAEPDLAAWLKRLCATPSLPGLPFITAASTSDGDLAILRTTLNDTLADPALGADLATLRLSGATVLPDTAYDTCLRMEQDAIDAGYPRLQ